MSLHQHSADVVVETPGPGLVDCTRHFARVVRDSGIRTGLMTLFIQHTSASLCIQENADPDVLHDLHAFFRDIAPRTRAWRHHAEGPDDMPAHVRAALTQTSLGVPVVDGSMALGTWQGIYVFEHRDRPHARRVRCHLIGNR